MNFIKRLVVVIIVFGLFSVFLVSVGKWQSAVIDPVRELFGLQTAEVVDQFGTTSGEVVAAVPGVVEDLTTDDGSTPAPAAVEAAVEAAPVTPDVRIPDYRRDAFGPAWADVDHNGCDTRNDILARDLTNETFKAGSACVILTGTLADPYTGTTIQFVRGEKTSSAVQIDHVVSLHTAWSGGAWNWTDAQREAFANDPEVLFAVDGPTNNAKSDKTPAEWTPPNEKFECLYVTKYVYVTVKYGLTIPASDKAAIYKVLDGCAP